MTSQMLNEWERAEVERSAEEAAHINLADLIVEEKHVRRYVDPPADTCYPLEYTCHLLGDVRGKTVLEYGCGDGSNTLFLARYGANLKALDISPELIGVARRRLYANHVAADVEFIVGSAHELPLPDESVDVVYGIAILHHLDLALSAREVRRVLRKGGRAIFMEPVRNSAFIRFLRRLIPYQAPGVSPYERPLTDKELETYAADFSSYRAKAFVLPTTNLLNLVPPLHRRFLDTCYRMDAALLNRIPSLGYFAVVRVVEMVK